MVAARSSSVQYIEWLVDNYTPMTIPEIIFYVLLIDSISCNLVVWFGKQWYTKHFHIVTRFFPLAAGWAFYYLVLVLWIGWLLYQQGSLTLLGG